VVGGELDGIVVVLFLEVDYGDDQGGVHGDD